MRRFVFLTMVALVMAVVLASPAWAATFTVDRSDDPDLSTTPTADDCTDAANDCSMRGAINAANSSSGVADTINFNLVSPATITLGSQLPTITDPAGLIIDGGSANITVSGNNTVRVFEVGTSTISGAKLTLNNLTVANGRALLGAGILNNSSNMLMVNNSTLSGNNANEHSSSGGGGIWNYNSATLTVSNSTLSGNSARAAGGGIHNNVGTVTLKNTIVANSPSGRNCSVTSGGPITNGGYNLDSDGSCGFGTTNHSLSGTTANPLDPQLGTLNDNGGPTKTHALLEGSPAIGKGNNAFAVDANGNALQFDQRGVDFLRIGGAGVDIGA